MPERVINTFIKGMYQDVDKQYQPEGTYRYSKNGKVFFNKNGTGHWENIDGNISSFSITNNYQPIGNVQLGDKLVIFSTNGTNSEIGYATINLSGVGIYTVIFNDTSDPNSETLNFSIDHPISAKALKENKLTERIYWTDKNSPPRVINILADTSSFSVHNMNFRSSFEMGRIKYVQTISGSLLSGAYQYTYRLATEDGYYTPFYPITTHIMLTTTDVDGTNWTKYYMGNSGEVTAKGIEIQITGIDQKYDRIEVVGIYSQTDESPLEAVIFFSGEITATSMTFQHKSNSGVPIELSEIPQQFTDIRKCKDISFSPNENRLIISNIETQKFNLQADLTNLRADVNSRYLLSDVHKNSSAVPFTGNPSYTTKTNITSWSPTFGASITEEYEIKNEYSDYKGTQVEHLYRGYFRGETYRLGILFFDKNGNELFVQHLCDVDIPEMNDDVVNNVNYNYIGGSGVGTTWSSAIPNRLTLTTGINPSINDDTTTTTLNAIIGEKSVYGAYVNNTHLLRIAGLRFRGINLDVDVTLSDGSVEKLYNLISGFAIVRAKRDPKILAQGLLLQTVYQDGTNTDTYPLPHLSNLFNDGYYRHTTAGGNYIYKTGTDKWQQRGNTYTFESPDFLFDSSNIPGNSAGDRLKIVGNVHSAYFTDKWGLTELSGGNHHFTACLYRTDNMSFGTQSALIGDDAEIESSNILDLSGTKINYDSANPNFQFINRSKVKNGTLTNNNVFDGRGHQDTLLLKTGYFSTAPLPLRNLVGIEFDSTISYVAYRLCNYIRVNANPYGGVNETSLSQTIYIGTGHFQPINATVIAATGGIFNDIEVWGGDCYVGYFGYARILPALTDDCTAGMDDTYGVGTIFPCESIYNVGLRSGIRTFEGDGIKPWYTVCSGGTQFPSGIYPENKESFLLNSVVLQEEMLMTFSPAPYLFKEITDFPTRSLYSEIKIYGETEDNYRNFLVNNFQDLDGSYGEIIACDRLFNFLYVIQEGAFGRLRVSEREVVSTQGGGSLNVGTGAVFSGVDYISTQFGSQHRFSVCNSGKALYWVDANMRKILRFAGDGLSPISDVYGLHDFSAENIGEYIGYDVATNDGGIISVFDIQNDEVNFTLRFAADDGYTITFNETGNCFVGFFDYLPTQYYKYNNLILSSIDGNDKHFIWAHGLGNKCEFYGIKYNPQFEYILNPTPAYSKVYDNGSININSDGVDILKTCIMSTEWQSHTITFETDLRPRYRNSMLFFPYRGIADMDRLRGKYLDVLLEFKTGTENKDVNILDIESKYRLEKRI